MSRHPESIFSDTTWKDTDGSGGLRNLYNLFYSLLVMYNMPRRLDEKTEDQRKIREKAALINLSQMYSIGSRIQNDDYVTPEERVVWERVNYDINREALRGRLRAFDTAVLHAMDHPTVLTDHQSNMKNIFAYIQDHQAALETWSGYQGVVLTLEKMGISI